MNDEVTQVRSRFPRAMFPPPYRLLILDPGHAVAVAGNSIVQISTSAAECRNISPLLGATQELCRQHERIAYLAVLGPQVSWQLSKERRSAVEAMVTRFSARYGAAAIVFMAEGFAATTARSVITSINLATGAGHPNRVFSELAPALEWLTATFPQVRPDRDGLSQLVSHVLQTMEAMSLAGQQSIGAARTTLLPSKSVLPDPVSTLPPRRTSSAPAPRGAALAPAGEDLEQDARAARTTAGRR